MQAKNLFNTVQQTAPNSNSFDLSHDVKMSLHMGSLYPCMVLECVPGDKFNISCESLLRFAPLVSPVMHRMDVTIHYFFVPNRLVFPEWEDFIVGQSTFAPAAPVGAPVINLDAGVDGVQSLSNYLGLPVPQLGNFQPVSAIPYAAYQCIYNEYYRDQNLIQEVPFTLNQGSNDSNSIELKTLRRRAWEHDYFTAALPASQKGQDVGIPTDLISAPVVMRDAGLPGPGFMGVQSSFGPGATNMNVQISNNPVVTPNANLFYADLTNVTSTTNINDLRRSFRLQEWLEKNARGGSRYIEHILSHFGVRSSDARLNRPEYITGTKSPVVISEVLNTDGGTLPQGNMAGHGISVTGGQYGSYYCEEHGYIMGIMSVIPKTAYQQGIPRHFLKQDPLDYYWPTFANIGEQEIQNKELYVDHSQPDGPFGYIPRYSEYKFLPSRVAGEFQDGLEFWHLGRIFATEPNLNQAFVECDPSRRIFAVTDPSEDILYAHVHNKVRAIRKMPVFGTPTF